MNTLTLTLKNIRRSQNLRWQEYCLTTIGSESSSYVATILETDQIQFRLNCPSATVDAKLVIGGAELRGGSFPASESDDFVSFNFMPKTHQRFGFESFFLHYCGIAQIAAIFVDGDGRQQRVLFEPINVCGRKITSDRVVSILEYLSKNITKDLLKALSPTQLKASLVSDGVSAADRLQLLENTIKEIDGPVRRIAARPLKSLRPSVKTIQNPIPEKLSSDDLEWVIENAGQSIEAGSSDVALFHYGLKWRTLHEIQSVRPSESTNIEENLIAWHHLSVLRRAASEIMHECSISSDTSYNRSYEQDGDVYTNFSSIANRILNSLGESYYHRAKECLNKIIALIRIFEGAVPTEKLRPTTLRPTLKMQANEHYMQLVQSMHSWLETREVVWLEKNLFSSINSTWKLFEYYLVVNTHKQLCMQGSQKVSEGLFSGVLNNVPVNLLYEPIIPVEKVSKATEKYVVVDRFTGNYREPDIVIEIGEGEDIKLLILDAKCRSEKDVWRDLQKCELKYTGSIRNKKTGSPIVKSLVMVYPMTTKHTHSDFQDYYTGPYRLNGSLTSWPVMGLQRVPISSEGLTEGYKVLLDTLLDKLINQHQSNIINIQQA